MSRGGRAPPPKGGGDAFRSNQCVAAVGGGGGAPEGRGGGGGGPHARYTDQSTELSDDLGAFLLLLLLFCRPSPVFEWQGGGGASPPLP